MFDVIVIQIDLNISWVSLSLIIVSADAEFKPPQFKVGDRIRITKYKNSFSKDYTENQLTGN